MRLHKLVAVILFLTIASAPVMVAQLAPAPNNRKLAFLIPDLYGPSGLTLPNPNHEAHFDSAFQSNFGPLNTALASQLTSLPIPSPASGFTYSFDKAAGVYTRSAQSFGPILAERAETIGKDKFYFGFSYQHFNFDKLDGQDLHSLPAVFTHVPVANPDFNKDLITTKNYLDIQLGQFTSFFSYGLTDRIDVSVAIPLISAKIDVTSDATIQRIGTAATPDIHYFDNSTGDRTKRTFTAAGDASGIGDVIVRLKGTVARWSAGALAVGADVRLPTGDEYDFLGSGATGVKPFVALSFRKKAFAPHVNLGYQWNDSTVLAGDLRTGAKGHLPNQMNYAVGFDAGLSQKLTIGFDILGNRIINGKSVVAQNFTAANNVVFPQVGFRTESLNITSAAAGFKVNPVSQLLVSFNLLFRLNDAGLHDKVTPLIGASWTF